MYRRNRYPTGEVAAGRYPGHGGLKTLLAGQSVNCHIDMFIAEQVQLDIGVTAAAARLSNLISGPSLIQASHEAWNEGHARVGPIPGLSKLVTVRYLEPAQQGTTMTVGLRWEATGIAGRAFPALDANLTLIPDHEQATILSLQATYRPPGGQMGAELDRAVLHHLAQATIRSFLTRVADAIAHPAKSASHDYPAITLDISPDRLAPDSA